MIIFNCTFLPSANWCFRPLKLVGPVEFTGSQLQRIAVLCIPSVYHLISLPCFFVSPQQKRLSALEAKVAIC